MDIKSTSRTDKIYPLHSAILLMMLACILILGILDGGVALPSCVREIVLNIPKPSDILPKLPSPSDLIFQTKCIEAVGCFYTGPPFYHPINRPISLTPVSDLKTKFILFTRVKPKGKEIHQTIKSIRYSSFNAELPVKVIIHGYGTDLEVDDIRFEMKDALLRASDYNIIIVDWTFSNGPPYAQAVANARAVGAQFGNFLLFIMKHTGVHARDIHIIGHSLGAHISGYAGEKIPGLGRITGLDPAGPFFQHADKSVRLDVTDAEFVDIIHTDSGELIVGGLGLGEPIGDIDFYPNGGRGQPGCIPAALSDSLVEGVINETTKRLLSRCDHGRANYYFKESIDNSKCKFLAVWCNSYSDFEKGDCLPQNSIMSEMGFHAKRISGVPIKSKFYLRTKGSSPFCIEDSVYL